MEIITRKEAMSRGLTHYFTGKTCRHGHVCKQTTKGGNCIECNKVRFQKLPYRNKYLMEWRAKNVDHKKRYQNKWIKENPGVNQTLKMLNAKQRNRATPKWLTVEHKWQIEMIFANCPNGYEIDHIVPIKGITPEGYPVSGLNVPWNLQAIPWQDNATKYNRMTQRCYEIACSLKK